MMPCNVGDGAITALQSQELLFILCSMVALHTQRRMVWCQGLHKTEQMTVPVTKNMYAPYKQKIPHTNLC